MSKAKKNKKVKLFDSVKNLDVCVISDIHLGTRGCCADELNQYLKSINPKILVLNGDIIDGWRFKKNYFPKSHIKIIRRILKMASNGVKVYYITGNHDEFLRGYENLKFGNIEVVDKLELEINNKKVIMFHGDIFDVVMKYSKWLGLLGSWLYDVLIWMNTNVNGYRKKLGLSRVSFSSRLKKLTKGAVKFISDFEKHAISYGEKYNYDIVCCGHIHQPKMKQTNKVYYLNSGDWIENLTAIECKGDIWKVKSYLDERPRTTRFTDKLKEDDDLKEINIKDFYKSF